MGPLGRNNRWLRWPVVMPNDPWRQEIRDRLDKQDALSERLLDGAQASIYLNMLLVGDERYGIKGFMPEVRERLESLERRAEATETNVAGHHAENSVRFDLLEVNQHRIRRGIRWLMAHVSSVQPAWKVIATVLTALGIGNWSAVKRAGLALWHALGR